MTRAATCTSPSVRRGGRRRAGRRVHRRLRGALPAFLSPPPISRRSSCRRRASPNGVASPQRWPSTARATSTSPAATRAPAGTDNEVLRYTPERQRRCRRGATRGAVYVPAGTAGMSGPMGSPSTRTATTCSSRARTPSRPGSRSRPRPAPCSNIQGPVGPTRGGRPRWTTSPRSSTRSRSPSTQQQPVRRQRHRQHDRGVRRVDRRKYIQTYVQPGTGGLKSPSDMVFDASNNLYVSSIGTGSVSEFAPRRHDRADVRQRDRRTRKGWSSTASNNLYVSDATNNDVLKITPAASRAVFIAREPRRPPLAPRPPIRFERQPAGGQLGTNQVMRYHLDGPARSPPRQRRRRLLVAGDADLRDRPRHRP